MQNRFRPHKKLSPQTCKQQAQAGSVLISILAAVGMVGVLSYTAFNMLSGPVRSAAMITANTKVQNDMEVNARLLIRATTMTGNAADPPDHIVCSGGLTAPTNGGCLPTNLGLLAEDAWRQAYRYCELTLTLPAEANKKFIAIISSGPDRVLQTTACNTSASGIALTTSAPSDDVIVTKTYAQANAENFWKQGSSSLETLDPSSNVTVGNDLQAGSINNTPIGATNASSGSFTTLSANSTATFTGSTVINNLSVAGSGTSLVLNPSTAGTLDNTAIGASVPAAGTFTNLTATNAAIAALAATNANITTATIGTANLTNVSKSGTGLITNWNADLLDGQHGAYYQNAANLNAGTLAAARMPGLTGDVTSAVGTVATTVVKLQGFNIATTTPGANTVLGWDGTAWGPMVIGGSGVSMTETDPNVLGIFKSPVACSDGFIPKVMSGAWSCTVDNVGALTTGDNIALPINADNATSPVGLIVKLNNENFLTTGPNAYTTGNMALGYQSGKAYAAGAVLNTFAGYQSGLGTTTGKWNVFYGALSGASNITGAGNAAVGYRTGYSLTSGSNNVLFGYQAGDNITTGTGNLILGYDIDASSATVTDELRIGSGANIAISGTIGTGNLTAQGTAWNFSSDSRLKKDIKPLKGMLSLVERLQGVTFKWNGLSNNDTTSTQYGMIAQEVQKIFPDLVSESQNPKNGKTYLQMNYNGLIPVALEAIKEQQAQLEQQQAQINELKDAVSKLYELRTQSPDKSEGDSREAILTLRERWHVLMQRLAAFIVSWAKD